MLVFGGPGIKMGMDLIYVTAVLQETHNKCDTPLLTVRPLLTLSWCSSDGQCKGAPIHYTFNNGSVNERKSNRRDLPCMRTSDHCMTTRAPIGASGDITAMMPTTMVELRAATWASDLMLCTAYLPTWGEINLLSGTEKATHQGHW